MVDLWKNDIPSKLLSAIMFDQQGVWDLVALMLIACTVWLYS